MGNIKELQHAAGDVHARLTCTRNISPENLAQWIGGEVTEITMNLPVFTPHILGRAKRLFLEGYLLNGDLAFLIEEYANTHNLSYLRAHSTSGRSFRVVHEMEFHRLDHLKKSLTDFGVAEAVRVKIFQENAGKDNPYRYWYNRYDLNPKRKPDRVEKDHMTYTCTGVDKVSFVAKYFSPLIMTPERLAQGQEVWEKFQKLRSITITS